MPKNEIPEAIRTMADYVGCKPEEIVRLYEIAKTDPAKASAEAEKLGLFMAF